MIKSRYLNFPIMLLQNATVDARRVCDEIMDYSLYAATLKFEGNDADRLKCAQAYCGMTYGNPNNSYAEGSILYNSIPTNNPKTGNSVTMILDFYINYKTDFEIESWLGFCAIRSILQTKPYCKITNDYLLARMAGYATSAEGAILPEQLQKYQSRYHMDKLKEELQNNWHLKIYSYHMRGYYVSFSMELRSLGLTVEQNRESRIRKEKKNERNQVQMLIKNEFDSGILVEKNPCT